MAVQNHCLRFGSSVINHAYTLINSLHMYSSYLFKTSEFNFLKRLCQELTLKIFHSRLRLFLQRLAFISFSLFFFSNFFFFIDGLSLLPLLFLLFFTFSFLFFLLHFHGSLLDFLFAQEILSCFHLDIFDSGLLFRRERSVLFLFDSSFFLFLKFDLFEFRQKAIPIFILKFWIFHEFPLNH